MRSPRSWRGQDMSSAPARAHADRTPGQLAGRLPRVAPPMARASKYTKCTGRCRACGTGSAGRVCRADVRSRRPASTQGPRPFVRPRPNASASGSSLPSASGASRKTLVRDEASWTEECVGAAGRSASPAGRRPAAHVSQVAQLAVDERVVMTKMEAEMEEEIGWSEHTERCASNLLQADRSHKSSMGTQAGPS
jgi:hypothetical protein